MQVHRTQNTGLRVAGLVLLVLAVIVAPWLVWGDVIEARVSAMMHNPKVMPIFATSIVVLLAADVLLPIPSSLVAVAAGVVLGFGMGCLTVLVGLSMGSVVGYGIGAHVGKAVARRLVGERAWNKAQEWSARYGSSLVLALRPVPILAEASSFFAGATHMGFREYLTYSTLANAGVAVVYAGVGDVSADTGHLEVALMAGCVLPALAMVVAGVVRKGNR